MSVKFFQLAKCFYMYCLFRVFGHCYKLCAYNIHLRNQEIKAQQDKRASLKSLSQKLAGLGCKPGLDIPASHHFAPHCAAGMRAEGLWRRGERSRVDKEIGNESGKAASPQCCLRPGAEQSCQPYMPDKTKPAKSEKSIPLRSFKNNFKLEIAFCLFIPLSSKFNSSQLP